MHHVQLQVIQDFVLQNKEEIILAWKHFQLDPKSCALDVTLITWLI
jgi:hypothetical protein